MTTRPVDFDYEFIWALSAGTGAGITLKSDNDSNTVLFNDMLREFYLFQVEYTLSRAGSFASSYCNEKSPILSLPTHNVIIVRYYLLRKAAL